MSVVRLEADDISDVLSVQEECYRSELIESAASFHRKLVLFPEGCFGVRDQGRLTAYIFGHPWKLGQSVPLDSSSYALPEDADCMYVHDLAVAPETRGSGIAAQLIQALISVSAAKGLNAFALVAVQNSEAYWKRWGFSVDHGLEYGTGLAASYMLSTQLPKWTI